MGFPLRPVLCRIFMVELENTLVPTLLNYLKPWKRQQLSYKRKFN